MDNSLSNVVPSLLKWFEKLRFQCMDYCQSHQYYDPMHAVLSRGCNVGKRFHAFLGRSQVHIPKNTLVCTLLGGEEHALLK